jgi:thiamine kinase-like enzyme
MELNPENIYQYLNKKQLISSLDVVKGNYTIHPIKTRNNIMKVLINHNNSFFVKQTKKDIASDNLFNREINAYHLFKDNKTFSLIAKYVPSLVDYENDNNILITDLFYGSKSLHEYYMVTKNFNLDLAKEQAIILNSCHIRPEKNDDISKFPKSLPWILQLDRYNANEFFVNNKASTNIIHLIKENSLLQNELIKLKKSWQFTHLIHGDIKWINFLISENELDQKLIDWELADIGDPIWDVAGLLQSYITAWLFGFDNNDPTSQILPKNMEGYHINKIQPSAKAFLSKYLELQNLPESEHVSFYTKTIQLTAARIIQTSIEGVTHNSKIEANNMRCIQLAFNILKDPLYALSELFDIKTEAYV